MRVLVYYPGNINADRGTPLRVRNLTRALAARENVEAELVASDNELSAALASFHPTHVYGVTHNALPGMLRAGSAELLLVGELHGDMASELLESEGNVVSGVYRYLRQRLSDRVRLRSVDGLVLVSPTLHQRIPRRIPATVIWGGADLDRVARVAARVMDGDDERELIIGYTGNMRAYQGVAHLVAACERLQTTAPRPVRLRLVGDAPPDVRRMLPDAPWLDVVGKVPYSDVPLELAKADVLVVPRPRSRTAHYGFPSKLAEYMAAGRAIVATDVGMHGALVRDGETGLLIAPDSVDAIATAVTRLFDDELRMRLSRQARAFAEANLSWETLAAELVDFLEDL